MRLVQGSRVPAVVVAINGTVFVGHSDVSEDVGSCGIGRDNCRGSVKRTFCLIEVDGAGYVGGNRRGLVTRFANGVDLDGEGYRNTHLPKLVGEFDCLGS